MNRYLRMGTRRSAVPRPRLPGLDDGGKSLAREDTPAIDNIYQEIERELDVGDGLLEEEEGDGSPCGDPVITRVWSGERGAYVAVRAPKGCGGR